MCLLLNCQCARVAHRTHTPPKHLPDRSNPHTLSVRRSIRRREKTRGQNFPHTFPVAKTARTEISRQTRTSSTLYASFPAACMRNLQRKPGQNPCTIQARSRRRRTAVSFFESRCELNDGRRTNEARKENEALTVEAVRGGAADKKSEGGTRTVHGEKKAGQKILKKKYIFKA